MAEKKRILYAEDNANLRESVGRALDYAGFAVHSLTDGKYLVKALERNPKVDLVLVDNQMPRMTGLQVLEHIREKPWLDSIPVIVYSTGDLKDKVEKMRGIFFEKSSPNLVELIEQLLSVDDT